MKLVILITPQIEKGIAVAQAWQETGAAGVTIIRSHGLQTLKDSVKSGALELPLAMSSMVAAMSHVLTKTEEQGEILLSVVENDMVDALQQATSNILGDMSEPYSGIMIVLDVERAIGIHKHTEQT